MYKFIYNGQLCGGHIKFAFTMCIVCQYLVHSLRYFVFLCVTIVLDASVIMT